MKRIIILLFYIVLFPSLLMAQTQEEKRGIEEDKRAVLRSSEPHAGQTKAKSQPPPPLDSLDIVYFAELMPKRIAFRYDVCKVIVVLLGVENEYIDLDSQIIFLREKGLLPKRFASEFDPMQPLRRGLATYMFCKALEIKGGLSLRLFGVSERYALKELAFEGIMPSGNINDIISGEELVQALMQAFEHRTKKQKLKMVKPEQ